MICYKCDHTMDFEKVGYGVAKTVVAKCSNVDCEYESKLRSYPRKRGNLCLMNLRVTYKTLLQDSGFVGFQ